VAYLFFGPQLLVQDEEKLTVMLEVRESEEVDLISRGTFHSNLALKEV
jgi:hypothetical protein